MLSRAHILSSALLLTSMYVGGRTVNPSHKRPQQTTGPNSTYGETRTRKYRQQNAGMNEERNTVDKERNTSTQQSTQERI
eukprot:439602-Amorphochlora_amoeboformis.AAC.3